jgi:hypothetical protein
VLEDFFDLDADKDGTLRIDLADIETEAADLTEPKRTDDILIGTVSELPAVSASDIIWDTSTPWHCPTLSPCSIITEWSFDKASMLFFWVTPSSVRRSSSDCWWNIRRESSVETPEIAFVHTSNAGGMSELFGDDISRFWYGNGCDITAMAGSTWDWSSVDGTPSEENTCVAAKGFTSDADGNKFDDTLYSADDWEADSGGPPTFTDWSGQACSWFVIACVRCTVLHKETSQSSEALTLVLSLSSPDVPVCANDRWPPRTGLPTDFLVVDGLDSLPRSRLGDREFNEPMDAGKVVLLTACL